MGLVSGGMESCGLVDVGASGNLGYHFGVPVVRI